MSVFSDYKKELMDAAHNERIRLALSRAIGSYRANASNALAKFPHTIKLAEEVREIKVRAIDDMEKLAQQASEAIMANHGKAYIARTASEALEIIENLVGKSKLIVKAKSMTSEEINLREHLEVMGNEVCETDLGEFIIQKLHSKPMHILSPAIHVPREDVATLLSQITGEKLPPDDIARMVATARTLLREKFIQADIGISGANVVAADTGTLFIIENEGNARLATALPPIHIALVGMEKLVPTFGDANKVAEVTWRYANYTVPSYVNLISGPSRTGDIEKIITYGAHGPKELHVIFLDAGRTELAKHPLLRQALYCLRCGGCLYECPVFAVTAGHFGDSYFTGIGAVWATMLSKKTEKGAAMAYTCLTCGRCKVTCPMAIDTPAMIIALRKLIAEGESISPG
ncbi:MAG: LUD domain-containing protein [Dehalococcoidales bacterium]|jgi:L-lactate dehydrogenase complex protein LldG|nr:LUD domain-containing protein [Dehalococcoidales bacterium]MDP6738111.1 LUD domain-containing protein [Dehalococcoidales bacterium]